MSLKISDESLKHGRSGAMLRFNVHLAIDASGDVAQETKGYVAFRCSDGRIEVKPPITKLNLYGRRIAYHGTVASAGLLRLLVEYVTEHWSDKLIGDPDWNENRKELHRQKEAEGWVL